MTDRWPAHNSKWRHIYIYRKRTERNDLLGGDPPSHLNTSPQFAILILESGGRQNLENTLKYLQDNAFVKSYDVDALEKI